MSEHTPTPWHLRGGSIDGANYANVFTSTAFSAVSKEDAAFIVQACNNFDALREALEAIIDECPKPKLPYGVRVVEIVQAALSASAPEGTGR